LYINNEFYAKLPPEDKKIFHHAAHRSAEDVWKMAAEVERKAIEEITAGGGRIVEPNAEFKAALKKAGEGTWKLFYDTVPNAKEILESVKQYR
jgi:TRAP-type C4-dicarboxylate transport system substrate-binding protein